MDRYRDPRSPSSLRLLMMGGGLAALLVAGPAFADHHESDLSEETGEMVEEAGDAAEAAGDALGEAADAATKDATMLAADASITTKIKAKLVADEVTDALSIDVDTVDGEVTLTGRATTQEEIDRAGTLAGETEGVVDVNNHIQLSPEG